MKDPFEKLDGKIRLLKEAETKSIRGGIDWVGYLIRFAGVGTQYFYRMGVREGKRMRDSM